MTVTEAKVAVKLHATVRRKLYDLRGYAFSIAYVNEIGENPYIQVGAKNDAGNSVFYAKPEELEVVDWKAPEYMVADMIAKEERTVSAK